MSIDRGDFEGVSEEDLLELVTAQVAEGLRVEYKCETYGNTDAEKREFLKDVSALANCQGGHLILGIEETDGVATAVVGLGTIDSDAELLRLGQISRGGLEPRITGLRMKAIRLDAGGHVILIRVPRSWNPPHRVVAHGSNRFYMRNSSGVHQPNVEELRTLFAESGSALDQARMFRSERLRVIQSGIGERPLENSGRLILHIVPVASFSGAIAVDVEQVHQQQDAFRPMGALGVTPRFNYYGFINERGDEENYGYTQIFRNGALEATKARIVREDEGRLTIPGTALETSFFDEFSNYISGLRDIGVPPPLIIMITLEGVLGAKYVVVEDIWNEQPLLPEDLLILPECVLEDFGEKVDYHRAIRPAFDALWNAIGYPSSRFFNEDGLWVGN